MAGILKAVLKNHVAYIHHNPVKHGHAAAARDWPHSSIHPYLRQGIIHPDWAASPTIRNTDFGE